MLTFVDADQSSPLEHAFTVQEVVEAFGLSLGLSDYPIFDESYRATLNQRIADHFWFRRIAAETPQQFVFFLNRQMREVMPTFNLAYAAVHADGFNPFDTSEGESHSTGSGTTEGTGSSTSNATSDGTATTINSTTPASMLTNPEGEQYMDALTKSTTTGKNTGADSSTSSGSNTSKSDGSYRGRAGSWAQQLTEAEALRVADIDAKVCDALEPLFIQLWDDTPY